jgi:hypothetical protein
MMKSIAVLLAGAVLAAGCSGQSANSQFVPGVPAQTSGVSSQTRVISPAMPQITVSNGWTAETQVIEWSTGCAFPFSPHQFSLLPGQSLQMVAENPTCLLNTATKSFIDADPFAQSQGCVLGIRYESGGNWRFSLVRKLTGNLSRCTLQKSHNQVTLIFNALNGSGN